MDIIAAYREAGTYRGAAQITGTTHKTVRRVIARHEAGGAAFLASSVDPLPFRQARVQNLSQSWTAPRDIDTIEYFASPDDICRAFAGLQKLAAQPRLAPLGPVLSANDGGIGLDPAQWPTVWFKGGSEPGARTLGYLATNSKGQTFVVVAMLSLPCRIIPSSSMTELPAIVQGAFGLVR
jgi:hypothetical protein